MLEHDPEKWKPIFRKRSCAIKMLERQSIQSETIALWPRAALAQARSDGARQPSPLPGKPGRAPSPRAATVMVKLI
jgi:hypothetical protein